MDIINSYMKYVYILLIAVLLVTVIVFIINLVKMMKEIALTADKTTGITSTVESSKSKIDYIKNTENSWSFFISLFVVMTIIKETFKYKRRNDSLSRSFARSCIRHSSQITKIRF